MKVGSNPESGRLVQAQDRAGRGGLWAAALATGTALVSLGWARISTPAPADPTAADPLAAELERRLVEDVRPLLVTYCFACHSGERVKGDVDLASLTSLKGAFSRVDDLAVAREMLAIGEMPPKDKPRPTDHERLVIEQWLDDALKYVPSDAAPDPGWFTIHRLNRTEYRLTLRDLLGIDPQEVDVSERLPRDDTGYGFDNIADVLTMSPLAVEQYLDAAEFAIDYALGPVVHIGDQPRPVSPLLVVGGGSTLPLGGIHLYSNGAAQGEFSVPATGEYRIQVTAWEDHAGDENARLSLRINQREIAAFPVSGSQDEPEELVIRTRVEAGKFTIGAHFTNDYWKQGVADRNLAVASITVAGPLDEATTERRAAWQSIVGSRAASRDDTERATSILSAFATRAFRRPADSGTVSGLVRLYRAQRAAGLPFEEAVRVALAATLVSPNFLYRSLDNPDSDDPAVTYRLSGYELASRLSYFLWSSMPDEPLMNAAASGSLSESGALLEQVRRMLADPRADAFISNFAGQWLQLRSLDTLAIDPTRFPHYNDQLRADMISEATLFFGDLVRGGGNILRLLHSDYSFLNDRLAAFYGVQGVSGNEFRRVQLPESARRGGVLTMGAVLTVTSNTTRTSPVKRGLFVLDQILGTPPPPPPPDIPPLEQATSAGPHATLRQQLAAHVANPTCAVCHNRLDPIGLAFENFDATGRWRDEEDGKPIDASGTLPGGDQFAGAKELKALLLTREDQFAETLAAKVLVYAIGRGLEPFDRPAVRSIALHSREHGGRLDSLIEAVVLSDTFRTCRGREQRHD